MKKILLFLLIPMIIILPYKPQPVYEETVEVSDVFDIAPSLKEAKDETAVLLLVEYTNMLNSQYGSWYHETDYVIITNSPPEEASDTEVQDEFSFFIPVLVYHHILDEDENNDKNNPYILSTSTFGQHMQLLHENGYNTLTLLEVEGFIKGDFKVPSKSVFITFDDGYKSNFVKAYPILKEYDFKACVFMITSTITELHIPFDPALIQFACWDELSFCTDVFEYGSHTHNLHRTDNEKGPFLISKPYDMVYEDLKVSKDLLDTRSIAYPYGSYTTKTIEILKLLDYAMGFTTQPGYILPGDDPFRLKRFSITPKTDIETFKEIIFLSNQD